MTPRRYRGAVSSAQRPAARRLALSAAVAVVLLGAGTLGAAQLGSAADDLDRTTPRARCGDEPLRETGMQGRVPLAEYTSGRALEGYQCHTVEVAHQGTSGGFKVERYTDRSGHTCAYYDSTLLFPRDVLFNAVQGLGVITLDMTDPSEPVQTATLTSPAMLSPHESLLVNKKRGIRAAVLGNPAQNIGVVDLYDVGTDCRHPELLSSSRQAAYGHESGFAPDGRTFWVAGTGGGNLTAVDISDPRNPVQVFEQTGVGYHGLRFSPDGRTMYVASISGTEGAMDVSGLRVLDVSEVQDRKPDPEVRIVTDLTWKTVSIPQSAEPFTRDGRSYLLETDEYADYQGDQEIGAARIIDIQDVRRPQVVSDLRLEVHEAGFGGGGDQALDPGALVPVQGYAAHYCSVPYAKDPRIVACSMILSGLRILDISDLRHPREVAYFNRPVLPGTSTVQPTAVGAFAMSRPAWDVRRRQVWYSDGNSGFYVVGLRGRAAKLLRR